MEKVGGCRHLHLWSSSSHCPSNLELSFYVAQKNVEFQANKLVIFSKSQVLSSCKNSLHGGNVVLVVVVTYNQSMEGGGLPKHFCGTEVPGM
jgi:hypothetical protein